MTAEDESARAGQVRFWYGWGIPAGLMVVASLADGSAARIVWPAALLWMGGACALNARRCGRVHCYFTAPLFLALGAVATLDVLGGIQLGAAGWDMLGAVALVGFLILRFVPEWLWGRYREPHRRG